MDFLKNLLDENTAGLVSGLVDKAGFTADQATAFVPEAAGSVVDAVKGAGADLDFSNMDAVAQSVMDKVDVASLADKVGLDTNKVQSGLGALVPNLLQIAQDKAGGAAGIMSMLGEGGIGKIVGGLGKMFGK